MRFDPRYRRCHGQSSGRHRLRLRRFARHLRFSSEQVERNVEFTKDVGVAFEEVRSGSAVFAGFVRPTSLSTLLTVARAGGRMPQKSTYFYPKIPIGLLMRDLLDEAELLK